MKTIKITEHQEQTIIKSLINEELSYLGDKEEIVIKWLNNYFKPMENETFDDMGLPKVDKIVSVLDSKKQISKKLISLEKLFYILQTQFKNILQDKKDRDLFLWDTIKKWYK